MERAAPMLRRLPAIFTEGIARRVMRKRCPSAKLVLASQERTRTACRPSAAGNGANRKSRTPSFASAS